MTVKNEKMKQNSIFRSVPQVISGHLPGNVKSINDMFYRMEKVTVGEDNEKIKEIIYNDLLNNIYDWLMFFFKETDTLEQYQISSFLNIVLKKSIDKNFTFNSFQDIKGFQEKDFAVSEIVDTEEDTTYNNHVGSYFPFTWKCNHCNLVMYSKKKPSNICKCQKNSWKQLNVALISTSAKLFDLKSIKETAKQKDGFLKCTHCNAPLRIIEKHNISQYRLICSKNNNHINQIDEANYTLYSLYSNSLFHTLKNEIVNFNQQDLFFEKKSTLLYGYIKSNKLIGNNDEEIDILEMFINDFDLYNNKKIELRKYRLKESLKKLESIPSFKKTINNLINTNKIISEEDLADFYHKQILEKISSESMENITQNDNQLFNFEKIGILKDIQVINYTYGYSRISDKPITTQTGLVKLRFFYRDSKKHNFASTSNYPNEDYLKQIYFTQESNKGIYFKLNTEKLENFLKSKIDIENNTSEYIDSKIKENKFIYLHSLCHYLIRLISQNFSGISTSSLTELIFPKDSAFLIYKKGTGKELGYLEAFFNNCIRSYGDKFEDFWEEVNNQNNLFCPGSELCNGACPECLMISKHSCKYHNEKLDRNLLLK